MSEKGKRQGKRDERNKKEGWGLEDGRALGKDYVTAAGSEGSIPTGFSCPLTHFSSLPLSRTQSCNRY
jgi:hypothetical protein